MQATDGKQKSQEEANDNGDVISVPVSMAQKLSRMVVMFFVGNYQTVSNQRHFLSGVSVLKPVSNSRNKIYKDDCFQKAEKYC